MNPPWPYRPRFSAPPPPISVSYAAAGVQQPTWNTVNTHPSIPVSNPQVTTNHNAISSFISMPLPLPVTAGQDSIASFTSIPPLPPVTESQDATLSFMLPLPPPITMPPPATVQESISSLTSKPPPVIACQSATSPFTSMPPPLPVIVGQDATPLFIPSLPPPLPEAAVQDSISSLTSMPPPAPVITCQSATSSFISMPPPQPVSAGQVTHSFTSMPPHPVQVAMAPTRFQFVVPPPIMYSHSIPPPTIFPAHLVPANGVNSMVSTTQTNPVMPQVFQTHSSGIAVLQHYQQPGANNIAAQPGIQISVPVCAPTNILSNRAPNAQSRSFVIPSDQQTARSSNGLFALPTTKSSSSLLEKDKLKSIDRGRSSHSSREKDRYSSRDYESHRSDYKYRKSRHDSPNYHSKDPRRDRSEGDRRDYRSKDRDERGSSKYRTSSDKHRSSSEHCKSIKDESSRGEKVTISSAKADDQKSHSGSSGYRSSRSSVCSSVLSPKKRKRHSSSEGYGSDHKRKAVRDGERSSTQRQQRGRARSPTPEDLPSLSTKSYKYVCSSLAEKYYLRKSEDSKEVVAQDSLKSLHFRFKFELVDRAERIRASKPKYEPPKRKTKLRKPKPPRNDDNGDSSSSSSSCSDNSSSEEEDTTMEELERKRQHPDRLHLELWFNDEKEMNDGPLCRCSAKARRAGIRHGIYVGENHLPLCDPFSNNANRLYHYRITMTPHTNFLSKNPTTIKHDSQEYRFEGFSMFSHSPLPQLPNCKVIRFNYEYTIIYTEEDYPSNFTVQGLELFSRYLLVEILELVDLNWKAHNDPDGCPRFHFMPRFARELPDGGKELLSHCHVLEYLLGENKVLIDEDRLTQVLKIRTKDWQDLADEVKGMIVTCPGMKPSSIRVDQLDREDCFPNHDAFPVIVHFGVRPPQLSYAGNPVYQKAWRDYVKYRHLLANKPKVKYADRHKLVQKETRLQKMRMENDLKRDVTVVISSRNFFKTGIMSDIIQHAMLLPVLVCHLRFHQSLTYLEDKIEYKFADRFLLQLALTHPSYRENFGTNPDHARNSLTNCGLRQPQYGDRRIHYMNTRKRGINTLINIMARFGSQKEATSSINHNERLEFLGDAVVEFLSSIHLFYMFPDLEEGGLATYRAAIVQNQHLAVLSKKLELDRFMLYAHGSDLCHDLELRHAMANCFEALMGALFLDSGIESADKVFSRTLFTETELLEVWKNFSPHPLQEQEPNGDRKWIALVPLLQKLHEFEKTIGIEFNHIRLLARALTHRSLGYNNLTLGSNQRLEFLGDTVLQLVASEYLYKFFPEHHEGHLSLLRSSLVNNRTQAVVCADLGMVDFAIYHYSKVELKPKDKADLLEAFLGALYVDKDLGFCRKFCEVCFFPRLQDFIMNQDWNDPKSKLQQCCLTLRSMDGGEPDIPTYKVIECKGPTNTRVYSVAVYFQNQRLAVGSGHSIQQAEMDAAGNALMKSKDLFPQLKHQRRAIERSLKKGPPETPSKSKKRNARKKRNSPKNACMRESADSCERREDEDFYENRDRSNDSQTNVDSLKKSHWKWDTLKNSEKIVDSTKQICRKEDTPRDLKRRVESPKKSYRREGTPKNFPKKVDSPKKFLWKKDAPKDYQNKVDSPKKSFRKKDAYRDYEKKVDSPRKSYRKEDVTRGSSRKRDTSKDFARRIYTSKYSSKRVDINKDSYKKEGAPKAFSWNYDTPKAFSSREGTPKAFSSREVTPKVFSWKDDTPKYPSKKEDMDKYISEKEDTARKFSRKEDTCKYSSNERNMNKDCKEKGTSEVFSVKEDTSENSFKKEAVNNDLCKKEDTHKDFPVKEDAHKIPLENNFS